MSPTISSTFKSHYIANHSDFCLCGFKVCMSDSLREQRCKECIISKAGVFLKELDAGQNRILNRVEPCWSSHTGGGTLDSAEMWRRLPGNYSKLQDHFGDILQHQDHFGYILQQFSAYIKVCEVRTSTEPW